MKYVPKYHDHRNIPPKDFFWVLHTGAWWRGGELLPIGDLLTTHDLNPEAIIQPYLPWKIGTLSLRAEQRQPPTAYVCFLLRRLKPGLTNHVIHSRGPPQALSLCLCLGQLLVQSATGDTPSCVTGRWVEDVLLKISVKWHP